jgi:hypothetical protein
MKITTLLRSGKIVDIEVSTPSSRKYNISHADIIEAYHKTEDIDSVVDWFILDGYDLELFTEYIYDVLAELDII